MTFFQKHIPTGNMMRKDAENIGNVALYFLSFRDQLRIFHWQTRSYAKHKASSELLDSLSDKMDKFIEIAQEHKNVKLKIGSPEKQFSLRNITDDEIGRTIRRFRNWLSDSPDLSMETNMETKITEVISFDNDLKNIRDEMVADISKTLYLFTLH